MPEKLTELGARISTKLDELQAELARVPGHEVDCVRRVASELHALVAQQASLQATLEQRMERRVADRTEELSSLSAFLQTHSEREKASLARELHDALGGILTPVKMDLAWLETRLADDPQYGDRIRRLSALIDQGIDFKRKIIENLRPSLLDHLGLASALSWYVDEACRDAKIECRLRISERLERLPADLEIALYRLVQESVGNIVKHSRAKHLELTLERTESGLRLLVADDGVGIADLEHARRTSHGFTGMTHRVRSVNGTFKVKSRPGEGTRIDVFVPLQPTAATASR
jgi:signal transduction histidine kinase